MKHIVSYSGGKDSTAMLIRMIEEGWPIDDIVFIKVMATQTVGADYPELYEYLGKVERYIGRKITMVTSTISFEEGFYQVYQKGKRAGAIYGFPHVVGAWCNSRLKMRAINHQFKTYGEHVRYLGLAADEPKRLARLSPNCLAPLHDWGMTEADCFTFLKKRDLMNPLYNRFRRLGCWFCPKQGLGSLRVLRHDYPALWQMMLAWDSDSPRPFKPDCTVHDLEARFSGEDDQLTLWNFAPEVFGENQRNGCLSDGMEKLRHASVLPMI